MPSTKNAGSRRSRPLTGNQCVHGTAEQQLPILWPRCADIDELLGEPAAIAESLAFGANRAVFSAAADLILAYRTDTAEKQPLRWFDRTGKHLGSSATQGGSPRLSLDGRQVAFYRADMQSAGGDVWVEDLTRRVVTRLTSHPAFDWIPIWSPDGNSCCVCV